MADSVQQIERLIDRPDRRFNVDRRGVQRFDRNRNAQIGGKRCEATQMVHGLVQAALHISLWRRAGIHNERRPFYVRGERPHTLGECGNTRFDTLRFRCHLAAEEGTNFWLDRTYRKPGLFRGTQLLLRALRVQFGFADFYGIDVERRVTRDIFFKRPSCVVNSFTPY